MNCPACGATSVDGAIECASCGVVMAKWRPRAAPPRSARSSPSPRPLLVGAIGLGGAAVVVGLFWNYSIRPRMEALEGKPVKAAVGRSTTLKPVRAGSAYFDLAYKLPGSPEGIASNGRDIVVGNRRDPWGAMRLRRERGDRFTAQSQEILEQRYRQKMNVTSLTWNGTHYVGLTTGSWFQREGQVFTIHDPVTLQIVDWKQAPKLVGCVAWDGKSYWAATRRHTRDDRDPAYLYKLDANLNVTSTSEPPNVGCQGLAFDGKHLWFADVFSDSIHVIDVSGATPQVVHSQETSLNYLSGLVVYDGEMWVVDYGDDMLRRIAPATRRAWAGGEAAVPVAVAAMVRPAPSSDGDIAGLQRQLRADGWAQRMNAEMELQRRGASVDFDREQNSFVKREPDDTDMIDRSAELHDDAVYASWRIWFGPDLFVKRSQTGLVTVPEFARYTVTVTLPDGSKVEERFDATPGENVMQNVRLAPAALPGEYRIDVFLHVQYVSADGQGRILNRNTTSLTLRK